MKISLMVIRWPCQWAMLNNSFPFLPILRHIPRRISLVRDTTARLSRWEIKCTSCFRPVWKRERERERGRKRDAFRPHPWVHFRSRRKANRYLGMRARIIFLEYTIIRAIKIHFIMSLFHHYYKREIYPSSSIFYTANIPKNRTWHRRE